MKVLVGVCGSIAAYKAAEVVRSLQDHGAAVEVAMTPSAERFIAPLTFQALTGKPVHTSLWSPEPLGEDDGPIAHIAVAQQIDTLLVAPATASALARFAHGMAEDFLSAVYLATSAPLVAAPAMNVNMWQHPATRANVDVLQRRGAHLVAPDAGYLACGMTGSGRLAPLEAIVAATLAAGSPAQDLRGETVLITAGGTREAIDAVRFLGNRSSGRMGHALAEAARARGARVLLVTAAGLPAPAGCEITRVVSTADMAHALEAHLPDATVVIGAAAVADFRPRAVFAGKLRREGALSLELEPTPDLIAMSAARRRPGALVIAFAAEAEDLERNAREKLRRKHVDAVVANDISDATIGFDSEQNGGLFLTQTQAVRLPIESKRRMADRILDRVLLLRRSQAAPGAEAEPSGMLLAR